MTSANRKPAKTPKQTTVQYVWPAEITAELLGRLNKVGPGARLRVTITNDSDAKVGVLRPVGAVTTEDDDPPDLNNAKRCPPLPLVECQ